MSLLTEERQDRIRQRLAAEGRVVAADLAMEFGTSEDTVRRDLRELARAGECRRVYGGALLPAPDLGTIAQRQGAMVASKAALARAVSALVRPGQTLLIDAGSTNLAVAQALPQELDLTVVTNAPGVALALAEHAKCQVVLIGGRFDAGKGAAVGSQALRDIQRVRADLLILGTCGVDARTGVTALDPDEAEIKRAMVEQSRELVVPATADKLGTTAPFGVAETGRIDVLVVPGEVGSGTTAPFSAAGVRVLRAAV